MFRVVTRIREDPYPSRLRVAPPGECAEPRPRGAHSAPRDDPLPSLPAPTRMRPDAAGPERKLFE
ncbi:hypothetical protein GCM10022198_25520 [Klugiella xanthotipulae]